MGLHNLLVGKNREKATALGERKNVDAPLPMYVGGIRWNDSGFALMPQGITDHDLEVGRFIRLKGYAGTFKIDYNIERDNGFYRLELIRQNPPEDYKEIIPKLEDYVE